ncbi:sporulation-delaying protein SdpB family protein [Paenibacillus ehimensis]|uniref:sporulation-delaying protein SdpB family protein n=1 Tax=Paenibacillus ehimensis TaxID=79264 RepID=UPI000FD8663B|nr:sporulation-delaying protein SdpB family protein [Paenibacillus ehimensis]
MGLEQRWRRNGNAIKIGKGESGMFSKIGVTALHWASNINPWSNVYGLARSIMALSAAFTLAINDAKLLFRPASGLEQYPFCQGTVSFFCLLSSDYFELNLLRWVAVFLLLIVASGWRPRYTGLIHFWIAYSLNVSAITIDGGEQVHTVITALLLPVALTDSRKWHWIRENETPPLTELSLYKRITALVSLNAIRVQMAILYLHSTIAKLFEKTWIDGTAVYYFLNDPMLGLPPVIRELLKPVMTSELIVIPTWGTLLLQMSLVLSLLAPKRTWKYFLLAALCLHEMIALLLGLISFSLVMTGALILYLRPVEQEFKLLSRFKWVQRKAEEPLLRQPGLSK